MYPFIAESKMSGLPVCLVSMLLYIVLLDTGGNCSVGKNIEREIKVLPFVTLYKEPKTLHIIKDYFRLAQNIDLGNIVRHMQNVTHGFTEVSGKYKGLSDTPIGDHEELEHKLQLLLEHTAETLHAALVLLPQGHQCLERKKRSIAVDSEPVVQKGLFPSVGNLFGWLTGTLSAKAGSVINENYNNIKRLTKMSVNFAQMFNATLSIERKHKQQLLNLKKQIMVMNTVLTDKISIFERKLAYQGFLQDLMLIVLDLRHTVDKIFSHVDAAEKNQLGALARDTEFLRAVAKLMKDDNTPSSLYLMKLGAKVKVEACGLHIQIFYKFPVLVTGNFEPWRIVSIPKEIKNKFFELSNIPFLVT